MNKIGVSFMSGLRSVTIGTSDMMSTKALFKDIVGMNIVDKNNALRFGDANLSPGTRLHFVEVPHSDYRNQHIASVGFRTPTDEGLIEYQEIFKSHNITFGDMSELNGHKHFNFMDKNQQIFDIYSNEHNVGIQLGMPDFDSSVNPLHQVQGLGPVILQVNELSVTTSLLTHVFGLHHFAEYESSEFENKKIKVFKIGDGGLGGEIHLYQAEPQIEMTEEGVVEQVEFATQDVQQFNQALSDLKEIGVPYQTLNQGDVKSIRITENSGISFIYTLEN